MIRKLGSVIGLNHDSLEVTAVTRTGAKLKTLLYFESHSLHGAFNGLRRSFSERLVMLLCSTTPRGFLSSSGQTF